MAAGNGVQLQAERAVTHYVAVNATTEQLDEGTKSATQVP